MTTQR